MPGHVRSSSGTMAGVQFVTGAFPPLAPGAAARHEPVDPEGSHATRERRLSERSGRIMGHAGIPGIEQWPRRKCPAVPLRSVNGALDSCDASSGLSMAKPDRGAPRTNYHRIEVHPGHWPPPWSWSLCQCLAPASGLCLGGARGTLIWNMTCTGNHLLRPPFSPSSKTSSLWRFYGSSRPCLFPRFHSSVRVFYGKQRSPAGPNSDAPERQSGPSEGRSHQLSCDSRVKADGLKRGSLLFSLVSLWSSF